MGRRETWLTAIGLVFGVVFAAGLALYSFLNTMATPLHPNSQDAPSVTYAKVGVTAALNQRALGPAGASSLTVMPR